MELLQDSDSSSSAIGPHWPSSYPEFLSPHQGKSEQQRIVWARLLNQRINLAKSLREQNERYKALRRELNPGTTQVESSHDPLYRDIELVHTATVDVVSHPGKGRDEGPIDGVVVGEWDGHVGPPEYLCSNGGTSTRGCGRRYVFLV